MIYYLAISFIILLLITRTIEHYVKKHSEYLSDMLIITLISIWVLSVLYVCEAQKVVEHLFNL